MHIITFLQQEFCKIRTVLACDARDEGYVFVVHFYISFCLYNWYRYKNALFFEHE